MTDSNKQIEILETTIDQAKEAVALMETLDKLHNNKDFQAIIDEELFDNYARTLVHLLSDPARQSEEEREDIIKDMEMVGRFRQFLSAIYQKGRMAEKSIQDSLEAIDEIREYGEDE